MRVRMMRSGGGPPHPHAYASRARHVREWCAWRAPGAAAAAGSDRNSCGALHRDMAEASGAVRSTLRRRVGSQSGTRRRRMKRDALLRNLRHHGRVIRRKENEHSSGRALRPATPRRYLNHCPATSAGTGRENQSATDDEDGKDDSSLSLPRNRLCPTRQEQQGLHRRRRSRRTARAAPR